MLFKFASLVLAASALAQTFSINTPASLVQCQPAALSWTGGTANFILAAIPGGEVSAAAIATIADGITSNSYTWTVNIASGTYITLKITDSLGNIAYSSPLTIQAGSSSDCLTSSASGSSAASTAGSTSAAAASGSASASAAVSSAVSSAASVSAAASSAVVASSAAASKASSASAVASSASKASSASTPVSSSTSAAAAASSSSSAGKLSFELPAVVLALFGGAAAFI